ncbi:MAG: hypothetical protein IJY53_07645 [Akkermansia sp.]|nr:hypothetical protein [Akkermansia sp.]
MNAEQKEKAKTAHGKLAGWLQGLGVPANWAKVGSGLIIGGIIGALATCQQSCTATYTQTAAGDIQFSGTVVVPQEYRK